MSKTKNWLMDLEEEFYTIADKVIGDCEHIDEFKGAMAQHEDKVSWTFDPATADEEYDDLLCDMWNEKWSKYATN